MLTIKNLYDAFRSDLTDPLLPGDGEAPDADSLWSDADIYRYINDAQIEVTRRTLVLQDILDIAMAVNTALYTVPEWVLRPRRAHVAGNNERKVALLNGDGDCFTSDDYGMQFTIASENTTGPVQALIFDERPGKARAWPIPTVVETVRVHVFRLPKTRITDGNGKLEVSDNRFERALLLYMKKRAYEKEDTDVLNKGKSEGYFNQFLDEIGTLAPETRRRVRRAGTVRYGGL